MLLTGLWRRPQRGSHHAGSARSLGVAQGTTAHNFLASSGASNGHSTHTPSPRPTPKPAVFTNMALGRISSAFSSSTALWPTGIQRLLVTVLKEGQGESENPTCFQPERSQTKQVEYLPSAPDSHPGNSEEEMR